MAKITVHVVSAAGDATALECTTGQSLMQAAVANNLEGIEAVANDLHDRVAPGEDGKGKESKDDAFGHAERSIT